MLGCKEIHITACQATQYVLFHFYSFTLRQKHFENIYGIKYTIIIDFLEKMEAISVLMLLLG